MSERLRGVPAGPGGALPPARPRTSCFREQIDRNRDLPWLSAPHEWECPAVLLTKRAGSQRHLRDPRTLWARPSQAPPPRLHVVGGGAGAA